MTYSKHKIRQNGAIELREITPEGSFHRSVIAPNQPLTKYNEIIEADPDWAKYRTQENADAYEAQLQAEQPSQAEQLQAWRETARVRTWKLKVILDEDNLLETVETKIAQSSKTVQLAWKHAPDVMRSSQAVNQILQALGLTPEQGDDIFIRAKQLEI